MPITPEKQLEIYHGAFQFLSPLAFDLRGTLSGIMVAADSLSRSDLSAEQRALVEQIARAGRTTFPKLGAAFDFLRIVGGEELPHGLVLMNVREQVGFILARAAETGKPAIAFTVGADVPGLLHCDAYVPRVIGVLVEGVLQDPQVLAGGALAVALDLAQPAENERVALRLTVRGTGSPERLAAMAAFLSQPPGETVPDPACGFGLTAACFVAGATGGQIRLERDAAGGAVRWVYEFVGEC